MSSSFGIGNFSSSTLGSSWVLPGNQAESSSSSSSSLLRAIEQGDSEKVKRMLSLNPERTELFQALKWSFDNSSVEMAQLLFQHLKGTFFCFTCQTLPEEFTKLLDIIFRQDQASFSQETAFIAKDPAVENGISKDTEFHATSLLSPQAILQPVAFSLFCDMMNRMSRGETNTIMPSQPKLGVNLILNPVAFKFFYDMADFYALEDSKKFLLDFFSLRTWFQEIRFTPGFQAILLAIMTGSMDQAVQATETFLTPDLLESHCDEDTGEYDFDSLSCLTVFAVDLGHYEIAQYLLERGFGDVHLLLHTYTLDSKEKVWQRSNEARVAQHITWLVEKGARVTPEMIKQALSATKLKLLEALLTFFDSHEELRTENFKTFFEIVENCIRYSCDKTIGLEKIQNSIAIFKLFVEKGKMPIRAEFIREVEQLFIKMKTQVGGVSTLSPKQKAQFAQMMQQRGASSSRAQNIAGPQLLGIQKPASSSSASALQKAGPEIESQTTEIMQRNLPWQQFISYLKAGLKEQAQ